jgi:outer membrane protein assembly factor BamE (lipoprotein component of BamABCDE complex)
VYMAIKRIATLKYTAIVLLALQLTSCAMPAEDHRSAVSGSGNDHLTVGTIQREIKIGMTNSEVAEILGSPNMVTTDDQRRESWIYDKIATEKAYSMSSGGLGLIFGGIGIPVGGIGGSGYSRGSGGSSTTQHTLTIIIKFDEHGHVRDYAYHSSSF